MKSALALTLAACLVTSPMPATAQEQGQDNSLARAITREAARLATTIGEPASTPIENVAQGRRTGPSDWSRVRQLTPVAEIIVTVEGAPPTRRYLLAGDDFELLALDGDAPFLSVAAKAMLRDATSTHELRNAASAHPLFGWAFESRKTVLLQPDGVFVGGLKVAELGQVEHIARMHVAEISVLAKPSLNSVLKWPALIGLGVGLATATAWYRGYCGSHSCDSQEPLVFFVYPMMGAGLGAGVGVLAWAGHDKTRTMIYRAP